MAEETKTKNTPFMERFIEEVYPKLSSGLIKNEEEGGKFLAETYKNILEGKANIKDSNIKLVSVNYDEAESLIVRGLSQNMLPIPTANVQESDENNPPGLKTMVDGFIQFWENSKWTEAPLGLACSPELVDVDGKKVPAMKVTKKENGKDELIAGMKRILEITRPVTKTDDAIKTDVKETLGMFAKELEQQFNKISGEYIGLDCNDSSKKITVNWDGIVFESLQITLVGLDDPNKAMTFVLAFILFILFMASSNLESTATSFGILLLIILIGSGMEEIQFSLTGGLSRDGKVSIAGQLAGGAGGTTVGGTATGGTTGGIGSSPKLDSIITQINQLTSAVAALA
jgi:hypothetical protein